jgi:hypothetical protein
VSRKSLRCRSAAGKRELHLEQAGASGRKKDLARTGKGLACNNMAGRHESLPTEPETMPRPELTTASLRLAPLKLLPFGGTARCRTDQVITTQEENHDNRPQIRVTSGLMVHGALRYDGIVNGQYCDFSFYLADSGLNNPPARRGWARGRHRGSQHGILS